MKNKKGQIKIQEMAFALVAILIFFGIVALFVFKFGASNLQLSVEEQREQEANELVRKLASSPEFALTERLEQVCESCLDLDKAMALKDKKEYIGGENFWNLDYLKIETLYPKKAGECNKANYPNCRTITILENNNYTGQTYSAYVALCRIEYRGGAYRRCDLGRIIAAGEDIK